MFAPYSSPEVSFDQLNGTTVTCALSKQKEEQSTVLPRTAFWGSSHFVFIEFTDSLKANAEVSPFAFSLSNGAVPISATIMSNCKWIELQFVEAECLGQNLTLLYENPFLIGNGALRDSNDCYIADFNVTLPLEETEEEDSELRQYLIQ